MTKVYLLVRILLGLLIAAAGIGKLLNIPGFVLVIGTYQLDVPIVLAWIIAFAVIIFEIGLGLWMVSGYRLGQAAFLSILMHLGYAGLLTLTFMRGVQLLNCGCFGVFLPRPLHWYTPLEDVVLIVISYLLYRSTLHKHGY